MNKFVFCVLASVRECVRYPERERKKEGVSVMDSECERGVLRICVESSLE